MLIDEKTVYFFYSISIYYTSIVILSQNDLFTVGIYSECQVVSETTNNWHKTSRSVS